MSTNELSEQDYNEIWDALTPEALRARGTAKWSYFPEDVLAAWVAEMDYPLAPPIRQALHEAIDRSQTGYPPSPALIGLPAAVAGWLERNGGLVVDPDQIRILQDVVRGIRLAVETFSPAGSPVVISTPAYPPFFAAAEAAGRAYIEVPMVAQAGRLTFDLEGIEAALREGARTVIVCNPHNPLGRAFTREELSSLAAIVEAHGARVLADELHAPLIYPDTRYTPYAASCAEAANHAVTLVSGSKGWNLPGLKCAALVLTNPADLEPWDKLPYLLTIGASILGMVANRAAFAEGDAWRARMIAYLDGNRQLLATLLAASLPQIRYTPPEATYLAWLDCSALALEAPTDFFLEHARVALTGGEGFGAPGKGFVRLNFATSRPLLTEIVRRMAAAVQEHAG